MVNKEERTPKKLDIEGRFYEIDRCLHRIKTILILANHEYRIGRLEAEMKELKSVLAT